MLDANKLGMAGGLAFLLFLTGLACAAAAEPGPAEASPPAAVQAPEDPYLWLEDVTNETALAWVKQQNALSTRELEASPDFAPIRQRLLTILDSKERIPYVTKQGAYYYNFWRDENNVRGLWRRTTLEEFKKSQPKWEAVLDLDKLSATENANWVWKGESVLWPTYDRCLLFLSRGGADAKVVREFDLKTKEFVPGGFYLPEAKSSVAWRNRDALYVGTDFGPGSLTSSGYPRVVKEWKRGTPLSDAKQVFEGKPEDVGVDPLVVHDHGRTYEMIQRGVTFFTSEDYVRRGEQWLKLDKPADAIAATFEDQLLLKLRSDWTVGGQRYGAGSLLAADFDGCLKGERKFVALFEPTPRTCLVALGATKHYLVLNELDNVRGKLYALRHEHGGWTRTALPAPALGAVSFEGIDPDESDDYFLNTTDFLTPSTLYYGTLGDRKRERLKSLPAFFNTKGLEITQHEATSKDGTKVPYFQVARKGLQLNGKNPTLLYGYGGFEIPMLPSYNAAVGSAWLERGGVYVLANIRGGGEFGPRWHEAARKEHRQRAYDDFIAVAEDLHARKVTSPQHLGIQGGSNGGLLMGVMLTQRPELFKAVVCQVPLLDMRRFNKLLAGASWMDEYGNPDLAEDWAYIRQYSPYQNVVKSKQYSRTLFLTSTRDDRVHPGHARKMVARMEGQGHDVLYYENVEGGHGGAANNKQAAYMSALAYTFLLKELQ
jgi:prolyl oligopeptidase